jgi:RND family efflux transporter MFP subunit
VSPDDLHAPSRHAARQATAESDLGFALPEPARLGKSQLALLLVVACAVVLAGFYVGFKPRAEQSKALARAVQDDADALPLLDVVQPVVKESTRPIALTATLQPLAETVLYARANGYIEQWNVDIGEHVAANQLLAVIETPELDQQLDQARAELLRREAALGQAKTQAEYAKTSLTRYERLRPAGVASQQELDQKTAEAHVADANVTAAQANVEVGRADIRRLSQLKSFSRVTAPFAGIITQRSIERGALVTGTTPLYRISNVDVLRAFVQVPQDLAVQVKAGTSAQINVREYPGRDFAGTLTRSSGALDPNTRTLTAEIRVDNAQHELLAGMYVQATLAVAKPHAVYEIPATALWNDADGLRVAVIDEQDRVRFRKVELERDAGAVLEITSGIRAGDRVVKLANAGLSEGDHVRVRGASRS